MAAAAVFSDKGYRASTIQDIGRELGTTSAALYYYFGSKQEILGELIVRPVRQLREMAAEVAQSPLSNREKLGEIVRRHIDMMLKQRDLFTIFLRERVELEAQHAGRLAEMEEEYYRQIRAIIEDAARAGEMRAVNLQMLALGIIGMTNWVLRWHKPDGALGADEIASAYMDILGGGAFKDPPGTAGAAPVPVDAAARRRVKRAS